MKLLFLMALNAVCAAAQYTAAGTVFNAVTGAPVAHAHVTIAPDAARHQETGQFTGADGRFRFDNLPGGKYVLMGGSRTIPDQMFGWTSSRGTGAAIVTGPGQNTTDLKFLLSPPSAISGKVVDEWGEPVRSALVQSIYSGVMAGRKVTRHHRYSYTNAMGEYRLSPLPAGEYYVTVSGVPWFATKGQLPVDGLKRGYATVYYPNTTDPAAAGTVKVAVGQDVTANFSVTALPASNVTLRLPSGDAPERHVVHLVSESITGLETFHRVETAFGSVCRLTGVPPGRYTVRSVSVNRPSTARQTFDVGGSDVELTLEPLYSVAVAGAVDAGEAQVEAVRDGVLRLVNSEKNGVFRRPLDTNGRFGIPDVPPGTYQVYLDGCPGLRIQSISAEGGKVEGDRIEIAGASVQMKIRAARANGAVRGVVLRAGAPVIGATVVLAPKDESKYSDHMSSWITDSDGSYDFTGIVPGAYLLLALGDDEAIEFSKASVLRPYLTRAQTVDVVDGKPCETRIELPAGQN